MRVLKNSNQKLRETKTRDGSKVIIINNGRILLLKRRSVPFIINPGIWAFVGGGRDKRETYLQTAYREVHEETGIERSKLKLVNKPKRMALINVKKPEERWKNVVFIFVSKTGDVKLNIENADYRWATFSQLEKGERFTNEFVAKKEILRMVRTVLKRQG